MVQKMHQQAIFNDGQVPARIKALAAALWAIGARCEPCSRYYIQQVVQATGEAVGEFLAVDSTRGA